MNQFSSRLMNLHARCQNDNLAVAAPLMVHCVWCGIIIILSFCRISSNSTCSICCGFVVQPVVRLVVKLWICCGFVVQLFDLLWTCRKPCILHCFDLLWICCRAHNKSKTSWYVEKLWICCGFCVQHVVQQIHNKSNKWSLSCGRRVSAVSLPWPMAENSTAPVS
jgi:hypothetical protein